MPIIRHYFPGNNTPQGFFSYYRYILDQREASKILCIKGGPGTGKSTLLKTIGERFQDEYCVDYLHCSADEESLDGVIIKDKNIAIVDGTNPHLIDPISPGAVDKIVNLGEYWDETKIMPYKAEIIDLNEQSSYNYNLAYNFLSCAEKLYNSLESILSKTIDTNEIYKISDDIIKREYEQYPVKLRPGKTKKFFASAITANGVINYLPTLIRNVKKVYMINTPVGYDNNTFMEIIKEGAVYRGYDVECYYCPMKPHKKIEHIIIPELDLGFFTTNEYHDVEPWQVLDENSQMDIVLLDVCDYMNSTYLNSKKEDVSLLEDKMREELDFATYYLKQAKEIHLKVEEIYIKSMNFEKLNQFVNNLIQTI